MSFSCRRLLIAMVLLISCFLNEKTGWSCAFLSEKLAATQSSPISLGSSDVDINTLVAHLKDCSLETPSPVSRWTHHPEKGETLYITDEARIVTMKAHKVHRSYALVDQDLNTFVSSLNHHLYFNGYGGKSNHLFVSLRVAFSQKRAPLNWKKFLLCYDKEEEKFIFKEFFQSGDNLDQGCSNLGENHYCVDFRNGTSRRDEEIIFQGKKIKFMFQEPGDFAKENATHSEPRAIHFISNHLELIKAALTVPDRHKIKFIQIGLHSFLDFCRECNSLVAQFQKRIREEIFRSFEDKNLQEKPSHVLLLISGQNNRLYNGKEYYFYDENHKRETAHHRARYFLKNYRPFGDVLLWDKKTFDEKRLIISVREPVIDPADQDESPSNVTCFVPLKTSFLYWGMAARELYEETEFFIKALNPNLIMADLSNARLGISEYDDYGDSCSASSGEEFQSILKALKVCTSLQHLDLSGNWLSEITLIDKGKNLLCQTFSSFQNLTFLSLENSLPHNALSQGFLTRVGGAIGTLSGLQNLNLSRNGFNADTFGYLHKGLNLLNCLRILDLSDNRLSHGYDFDDNKGSTEVDTIDTLLWIVNYAKATPTMMKIDLYDNDFDVIDFSWQEVSDEAELSDKNILRKIAIEDGISPGDFLSDSGSESGRDE